jgi:hypothetical protein
MINFNPHTRAYLQRIARRQYEANLAQGGTEHNSYVLAVIAVQEAIYDVVVREFSWATQVDTSQARQIANEAIKEAA